MSENQKLYEEFMRKFNLTTSSSLLSIEYVASAIYASSTEDGPTQLGTSTTKSIPPVAIKLESQGLETIPWNALVIDAILPTLALLLFYIFREMCLVLYRITKIKAKNPRIPFSETLYYSVFTTAILGKRNL